MNRGSDLDYEVGLGSGGFSRGARNVRSEAKKLGSAVQSEFQSATSASLGFAGVFGRGGPVLAGIAAAAGAIKLVSDSVNQLASEAKTAGTDFESFQELKYYFDQNLVGVDALTDGLKEMQLRLDEAATTGGGPAVEALQRLGYTAKDVSEGLKDPPRLLEEIIDRTKQLDKAAQIRVLDEIFGGTAAEQFQRVMDDAEGSISSAREEARKLGIVLDEDYLETVEKVNKQWQFMATFVGTNLRAGVIALTNDVLTLIDKFREVENRSGNTLKLQRADIAKDRLDIETQILKIQDEQRNNTSVIAQAESKVYDLQIAGLRAKDAELATIEKQILLEQKRRDELQATQETEKLSFTPTDAKAFPTASTGSSKSRKGAISDLERQAQAIAKLRAELSFEYDQLGRNALQQEIYSRLKSVDVDISTKMGQTIAQEVTALYAKNQALEDATRIQEEARQSGEYLLSTFEDGLLALTDGGDDAADSIKRLALQLAFAVAQAALLKSGPLAGLFGGGFGALFGGGGSGFSSAITGSINTGLYHSGTNNVGTGSSRTRQVPAHLFATAPRFHKGTFDADEIPAVLKRGEIVDPGDGSVFARKFGGQSVTYAPVIHFQGTGAELAELKKVMADDKANFQNDVIASLNDGRTRRKI